eukprot:m.22555 g.22555  ORF g.22555 m.22555 type:complete len:286 (-) comp8323_c0_seq1:34-891(-)
MEAGEFCELLDFYDPERLHRKVTLFVSHLAEGTTYGELHELFSQFGLIFDLYLAYDTMKLPENFSVEVIRFAFVKFYSERAAEAARVAVHKKVTLRDNLLHVDWKRKPCSPAFETPRILYPDKAFLLARHYLGFSGVTVKIVELEGFVEDVSTSIAGYQCVVRLDFPAAQGVNVLGLGMEALSALAAVPPLDRIVVCKRHAHRRALEDAFSKLFLMVLPTGRCVVGLRDTGATEDEDLYENLAEMDQWLVVTEVDELDPDPEEEQQGDVEDGPDGMSQLDASTVE